MFLVAFLKNWLIVHFLLIFCQLISSGSLIIFSDYSNCFRWHSYENIPNSYNYFLLKFLFLLFHRLVIPEYNSTVNWHCDMILINNFLGIFVISNLDGQVVAWYSSRRTSILWISKKSQIHSKELQSII
jgi:hypothetical protein